MKERDNRMNKEFLNLIKTRRSIRSYKPDPIDKELLDMVLEAGTYAPSAMGRQSPVIIAVTNKAYREELVKMNASIMNAKDDPYYGAPVIVLALADGNVTTMVEDASCALENMMLAAHALGLGSVWVHRERQMFDSEEGKRLLEKWNLPVSLRGVGAIALGYPKGEIPQAKERKKEYIVHID